MAMISYDHDKTVLIKSCISNKKFIVQLRENILTTDYEMLAEFKI